MTIFCVCANLPATAPHWAATVTAAAQWGAVGLPRRTDKGFDVTSTATLPTPLRVFSAVLATETNTFAPLPTSLASFKERSYFPAGQHPDEPLYNSGPLWAARVRGRAHGWVLHEGLVAAAQPGGVTTRMTYETLRDELLADLRASLPVDMVLLGLHGAMVADGYPDCEGDLLQRVRALVGPDAVIGAELDPHCHLSPAMLDHSDLLIAFKEYPHTDVLDRAYELVDLCAAMARGEVRPVAAVVDCEMVAVMHTSRPPMRGYVDALQELERQGQALTISVVHGFPWGDVADMGSKLLVYTDGDAEGAAALAARLAAQLIALKDELLPPAPDVAQALDEAQRTPGCVVIADGADNPGGGAAGDATFVLQAILARGIQDVAIGPLWDPSAAALAVAAGAGARLPLRIGGKIGPLSGDPVDLLCNVLCVQPAHHQTGLSGAKVPMGACALVEAQGVQIVLASLRTQAMGTDLFTGLGCDLASRRLIVVKSSQHFYAEFSKIASKVLYAQAPGTLTDDLRTLPYQNIKRPKWPLDR